ncbi:MAG: anti-sigma factor [Candidatus Acidiferrales bacterium]
MTNGHPTREEDFDLYALGALEADEKRAIETHVAGCASCSEKLAQAEGRMAMLALAAPQVAPSPGVKEALMRQIVGSSTGRGGTFAVMPSKRPSVFAGWLWALVPLAGGFACALVFLCLHVLQLDSQIEALKHRTQEQETQIEQERSIIDMLGAKDTVVVSLAEQKQQPLGTARVLYNAKRGLLVYNGTLPPAPADKSYQLWLVPTNGAPISAGVFESSDGGADRITAQVPPGTTAKAFAVTLEPRGGKPAPSGPFVLLGPVS